ncbi:MAG: FmdB family zinc ribbon protein [Silvanigrellaceae bacterium]
MPIYEFKCTNNACNNVEEHLLRHSDPLPTNCEKCASPIEKLVSQTSFALKGSGWYVTDYKGSNPGAASNSANASSSSNESAASTSTAASDTAGTCGAPACATSGCASE